MAKSILNARAILNHQFRTATLAKLGTVYVALHTADATAADLATELAIGVGGYNRAAVTVGDAQWSAPATSGDEEEIVNTGVVSFGTASADLGTITHFTIRDASTAGNQLYRGALGTPRAIVSTDPIQVPAGAMSIRES